MTAKIMMRMRPWGIDRSSLRQLFWTSRVLTVTNELNHHGEQSNTYTESSIVRSKLSMKRATSILRLIEDTNWTKLRKLMKKLSKQTLREIAETIGKMQMMDQKAEERNVLHLICAKDPPSDLVQKIAELCPSLLLDQDIFGQLPLHVAVACDAGVSVINTLLACQGDAVTMQDGRGRTPLMLACHKPHPNIDEVGLYDKYEMECLFGPDDMSFYPAGPRIEIVRSLLNAAPGMINYEDEDKFNALEFAVLSEANIVIMEALQRASQREWTRINKSQNSINRRLSKSSRLSSIMTKTFKMEGSSDCSVNSDISLSEMSSDHEECLSSCEDSEGYYPAGYMEHQTAIL